MSAPTRDFVTRRTGAHCVVCGGREQLQVHNLDEQGVMKAQLSMCAPCHKQVRDEYLDGGGPALTDIATYMLAMHYDDDGSTYLLETDVDHGVDDHPEAIA